MGLSAGARGSDEGPQMPAFRAVPTFRRAPKKNVSSEETGGAVNLMRRSPNRPEARDLTPPADATPAGAAGRFCLKGLPRLRWRS